MLDVHVIADDQLSIPVLSWTVRTVATNAPLGHIRLTGAMRLVHGLPRVVEGRYRLETVTGEVSEHGCLAAARDAAAAAFTSPQRPH